MSGRHRTKAEVVAEALRALNGLRERMDSARTHMAAGPVSVLLLEQVRADISDTGAMLSPLFAAQEAGTLDIQALVEGQIFPSPGAAAVDYVALWQAAYAAGEAVWPAIRDAVAGRAVATWGEDRSRFAYLTLEPSETAGVQAALTALIDVLAQG